jgi:hypothetical protein
MEFLAKVAEGVGEWLRSACGGVGEAEANAFDRFVALGLEQADGLVDQLLLRLIEAELKLLSDEGLQVG